MITFPYIQLSSCRKVTLAFGVFGFAVLQGCTNPIEGGSSGSVPKIQPQEIHLNLQIHKGNGSVRTFLNPETLNLNLEDQFELTSSQLNLAQTEVTTKVSCQSGAEEFVLKRNAGGKIPLLDMISLDHLEKMIADPDPLICDIRISVPTSPSSTKTFLIEQISVARDLTRGRGIALAGITPSSIVSPEEINPSMETSSLGPDEQGVASILCVKQSLHSSESLLTNFDYASLANQNLSGADLADPRLQHRVQSCMLVKRTRNGVTERSPLFNLRFDDLEPVSVTTAVFPDHVASPTQGQVTLLEVTLANSNSYPVGFVVPAAAQAVQLNYVSSVSREGGHPGYAFPFLTPWFKRPLKWEGNFSFTENGESVVWIRPFDRTTLRLQIRSQRDCWPSVTPQSVLIGFDFQLPDYSMFRLYRTRSNIMSGRSQWLGKGEEIPLQYNFTRNWVESRRLGFHYSIRQDPHRLGVNSFFAGQESLFSSPCPDEI